MGAGATPNAENPTERRPVVRCGTAVSVNGSEVVVAITKVSACDQCRAKLLCASMSGSVETVTARSLTPIKPGDRVRLELSRRAGMLAVGLAFLLPLLTLLAVFALVSELGGGEAAAGLAALAAVPVYYLLLFTQRRRLARRIGIDAYAANANPNTVRAGHPDRTYGEEMQ